MVRIPRSWARAGFAGLSGSGQQATPWVRPILRPPDHLYNRQVSVDLGNDGVALVATFTASGTAQALVGPNGSGDLWSLDQCYLSTSVGQFDPALCTVYNGPLPVATTAITASLAGGSAQFGMGGVGTPFGWFIYALWTGGTPGAFAFLRVTGVKTVLAN